MHDHTVATLLTLAIIPAMLACHPEKVSTSSSAHPTAKTWSGKWDRAAKFQAAVDPSNFDEALAREACFHATNEQRFRHDVRAVTRHDSLEASAQLHAARMTKKRFFSHNDPYRRALRTPTNRAEKVGIENPLIAENIAMVTTIKYQSGRPVYGRGEGQFSYTPQGPVIPAHTYVSLARAVLDDWMNSPGHRKNILNKDAVQLGCGISFTWKDNFPSVNAVQNFQFFEPVVAR